MLVASLTDNEGNPNDELGYTKCPPDNLLASYFNQTRHSPVFVPVQSSGYTFGPIDGSGYYMFAYKDFSDPTDGKFLLVS